VFARGWVAAGAGRADGFVELGEAAIDRPYHILNALEYHRPQAIVALDRRVRHDHILTLVKAGHRGVEIGIETGANPTKQRRAKGGRLWLLDHVDRAAKGIGLDAE
jgi:hypothetical protein